MDCQEVCYPGTDDHSEIEIGKVFNELNLLPSSEGSYCVASCPFFKQVINSTESVQRSKSAKKLCGLISLYLIFMAIEVIGGLKANSLAILTDAAHLLTDIASFSISLFALWASNWEATPTKSFGYFRLEILGALLSIQLIWLISGFLIYEAVDRLFHRKSYVNGKLMFAIAAFGFFINLSMVFWLGHHDHHAHHHEHDHDHDQDHGKVELSAVSEEESSKLVQSSLEKNMTPLNVNLQGAYLHVIADSIQSAGVMIAGLIVWVKPDWLVVDLVCTLIFALLVFGTTLSLLRNMFFILMESTPNEIDITRVEQSIRGIEGVCDIHDLHIWAITVGKIVLVCHVIVEPRVNSNEILSKIRDCCEQTYRIHHVTVQIEHING